MKKSILFVVPMLALSAINLAACTDTPVTPTPSGDKVKIRVDSIIMRFITSLVSLTWNPFLVAHREKQRPFFFSNIVKKDIEILQERIIVIHHILWMYLNFSV